MDDKIRTKREMAKANSYKKGELDPLFQIGTTVDMANVLHPIIRDLLLAVLSPTRLKSLIRLASKSVRQI